VPPDGRTLPLKGTAPRSASGRRAGVSSFTAAANSGAPIISITSFNEWHEGTQIEKAVPKTIAGGYRYSDYGSLGPEGYLDLTRELIERWRDLRGTY